MGWWRSMTGGLVEKQIAKGCITCGSCMHGMTNRTFACKCIIHNQGLSFHCIVIFCTHIEQALRWILESIEEKERKK